MCEREEHRWNQWWTWIDQAALIPVGLRNLGRKLLCERFMWVESGFWTNWSISIAKSSKVEWCRDIHRIILVISQSMVEVYSKGTSRAACFRKNKPHAHHLWWLWMRMAGYLYRKWSHGFPENPFRKHLARYAMRLKATRQNIHEEMKPSFSWVISEPALSWAFFKTAKVS